jgi:AAHS family 4-hydroxybenzoate transporter-like MFS transporter
LLSESETPRAATERAAVEPTASRQTVRRTIVGTCAMLWYQGFTMAINGIGAPWIAKSFGLSESGIARMYAWISLSAIGALALSRCADRLGRRRVLVWCMTATPLCAFGAALALNRVVFTVFEIGLYAFIAATLASGVVMLAETLPIAERARGQAFAGLAITLGGGLCVVVMPVLDRFGWSWRWLLGLATAGLLGVPFVSRVIPESARWERAASSGATQRAAFYDVFGPRHRRRAVPILVAYLLNTIAVTAATSWGYFHAVSVVGLSAGAASVMMLTGGGLSLVGFPLGAWASERFGRVPTVVLFGMLIAAGTLFFYRGPPAGLESPGIWLAAGFCWFSLAVNAATVGGNSAATELFPTALRGTVIGWFTLMAAIAAVASQAAIAVLAERLGGLSVVVGYLGLLAIPAAGIFGVFIEETRGMSLEVAAREDGSATG